MQTECRPQVFDLWANQKRYDILVNSFTERTWMMVKMGEEIQDPMKTYLKYPPREMQSLGYTGPITFSQYQRFAYSARFWRRKEFHSSAPD